VAHPPGSFWLVVTLQVLSRTRPEFEIACDGHAGTVARGLGGGGGPHRCRCSGAVVQACRCALRGPSTRPRWWSRRGALVPYTHSAPAVLLRAALCSAWPARRRLQLRPVQAVRSHRGA
jgi:hypothetical protein